MSWSSTTTQEQRQRRRPQPAASRPGSRSGSPSGVVTGPCLSVPTLILVDFRLEHWVGPRDLALENLPPRPAHRGPPGRWSCARCSNPSLMPEDRLRGVALLSANLPDLIRTSRSRSPSTRPHASTDSNGPSTKSGSKSPGRQLPDFTPSYRPVRDPRQVAGARGEHGRPEGALMKLLALRRDWARRRHAGRPRGSTAHQPVRDREPRSVVCGGLARAYCLPGLLIDRPRLAMACAFTPTRARRPLQRRSRDHLRRRALPRAARGLSSGPGGGAPECGAHSRYPRGSRARVQLWPRLSARS